MAGFPNPGARSAWWYRATKLDLSTSGVVLAAAAGAANVLAQPTTVPANVMTIYVQKIVVTITTAAAQTITFQDTNGTPIIALIIPASQAVGSVVLIDFGSKGLALTPGKNLSIVGTAGPAYTYSIEAYADGLGPTQATTVDRTV